jgi:hypothetical protein
MLFKNNYKFTKAEKNIVIAEEVLLWGWRYIVSELMAKMIPK